MLSAVYGSPNPRNKELLWENMKRLSLNSDFSCLVTGDFNDYATRNEKSGESLLPNHSRYKKFVESFESCGGLMDLGCVGPSFTWTNSRKGLANT